MPESEERLRMLYRAAAAPSGGHLVEEDWERLACGEMPGAERDRALDHVTRCAECARIYQGLDALAEGARGFDPGVPASARVLAFPRRLVLGSLAAAAALAVVMLRPASGPSTPAPAPGNGFRGGVESLDPAPLSPRGQVRPAPSELRWKGISTPSLYRVVILDRDGEVVWTSPDVDATSLPWPGHLNLKPGSYLWQVIALPKGGLPGDRRASALAGFEVATSSLP